MQDHEFLDEKIIRAINQAEAEKEESAKEASAEATAISPEERTIYTGIKIGGQWIEFEERSFMNDKVLMMVPREFTEMDEQSKKIKYPSEQRPEEILTDSAGGVNIYLGNLDEVASDDDVEMIRDVLLKIMQRVNPGIRLLETGKEVVSGEDFAYAEYANPAIDGKVYNLMFFFKINGRAVMGGFNCLSKSMKYWKKHALEIMQSIKVTEFGKEQGEDG